MAENTRAVRLSDRICVWCSVPGLYIPGPGYGAVAAQSGVDRLLGAGRAAWRANARREERAVRARCERETLGAASARCGRGTLFTTYI